MKFNYNPEYIPNPVAKLIDFDVVSTYVCPVKPLEIKEPTMTTAIEIGKTYKLVEPKIKTNALISGHKTLTDVFGEGEFIVEEFAKSELFDKSYVIHGRRLDNNKIKKTWFMKMSSSCSKKLKNKTLQTCCVLLCLSVVLLIILSVVG